MRPLSGHHRTQSVAPASRGVGVEVVMDHRMVIIVQRGGDLAGEVLRRLREEHPRGGGPLVVLAPCEASERSAVAPGYAAWETARDVDLALSMREGAQLWALGPLTDRTRAELSARGLTPRPAADVSSLLIVTPGGSTIVATPDPR